MSICLVEIERSRRRMFTLLTFASSFYYWQFSPNMLCVSYHAWWHIQTLKRHSSWLLYLFFLYRQRRENCLLFAIYKLPLSSSKSWPNVIFSRSCYSADDIRKWPCISITTTFATWTHGATNTGWKRCIDTCDYVPSRTATASTSTTTATSSCGKWRNSKINMSWYFVSTKWIYYHVIYFNELDMYSFRTVKSNFSITFLDSPQCWNLFFTLSLSMFSLIYSIPVIQQHLLMGSTLIHINITIQMFMEHTDQKLYLILHVQCAIIHHRTMVKEDCCLLLIDHTFISFSIANSIAFIWEQWFINNNDRINTNICTFEFNE